ncbi:MAG: S8 family serine peptidase [Ilumatobacteraceae bacterium]
MRISRAMVVGLLVLGTCGSFGPTAIAAPTPQVTITDTQLLAQIDAAASSRTESVGPQSVPIEVLTTDAVAVSRQVHALGGRVIGQVGTGLVQADVPLDALTALANTPGAQFVRATRRAGALPDRAENVAPPEASTGTASDVTRLTRANEWHAAGFRGAGVKIGVVDYFNMAVWNTTENGPTPTVANGRVFCQDTGGFELCTGSDIRNYDGYDHGLAVVEILKDMAPDAEVYVATVGTLADLQAAIDWFASKGVTILNRSLGSAYDGPGDGTGPSADVVNYAAGRGITWFNAGGDQAGEKYLRVTIPTTLSASGYVDFDNGPNSDTWLRLDGNYLYFDGIRWSDWYNAAKTDYSVEFWAPKAGTGSALYYSNANPTSSQVLPLASYNSGQYYYGESKVDASQVFGAPPLEATDLFVGTPNYYGRDADGNGQGDGMIYMRIRKNSSTPVGAAPDTLELLLDHGYFERGSTSGSAAAAFIDSRNHALVSTDYGWVYNPGDYGQMTTTASQGPTNDGRLKPDVSAPGQVTSIAWGGIFYGSHAASPVAAGIGALLQGAGLAASGEGTGSLVRHFVSEVYPEGPDNASGTGITLLPLPPTPAAAPTASRYVALPVPVRGLDTRASSLVGTGDQQPGPYLPQTVFDFNVLSMAAVPDTGVSAVAINLTSVSPTVAGYLQVYPYLRARNGATSTINIATAGVSRPNFAVVPVGQNGMISVYLQTGGNVIIDVLGYYLDGQPTTVAEGRFIPLAEPERWMDTRGLAGAPLPAAFTGTPRLVEPGEMIEIPSPAVEDTLVPAAEVAALVVNVTAVNGEAGGYLQLVGTGAGGATHSNVNFGLVAAAANTAIVPLGSGGTISVYSSQRVNVIVDIVGYITNDTATADSLGLFVPITTGRAVNTRVPTPSPFTTGESRTYTLTAQAAPAPQVPADAAGVSANLAVVNPTSSGFLTVYPNAQPATSNLNFTVGKTVANGAFLALSPTGTVTATMSKPGNLIIDINGYFLPAQPTG